MCAYVCWCAVTHTHTLTLHTRTYSLCVCRVCVWYSVHRRVYLCERAQHMCIVCVLLVGMSGVYCGFSALYSRLGDQKSLLV